MRESSLSIMAVSLFTGMTWLSCAFVGSGSHPKGVSGAANPTVAENQKPGDSSWKLVSAALNHEIEGYASAVSVNRGETITFFVNTIDPEYTLEVYRVGWYNGAGGRRLSGPVTLPGKQQPAPVPDATTGLIECQWQPSYELQIPGNSNDPTDWASGIYLVKLQGSVSHKQGYIIFVVRDDERKSALLFQSSVNTYEAYNDWGGESLYTSPQAYKVSFNRPYKAWYGSGDFLKFEVNLLRFLEREGYDVTYATDVDTHQQGERILEHHAFLVVGHDEYWSWQMRDNVEGARDKGVHLAFFAANTSYWQIRYEASAVTGAADRTMVCYKYAALTLDPYATDTDPNNDYLITTQFRRAPVNRPEDQMVGGMFDEGAGTGTISADIVVTDASNWVFQNTGLANGSHLPGLLGYEADQMYSNVPPGVTDLAHSPYTDPASGATNYGDMTDYDTPSGSTVVNTGSMKWNWGLDSFTPGTLHNNLTNSAAQQATRNILKRFGASPGTP